MDGFASEDDLGWVRPEPFIPAPGEAATPADANAFLAANVNQGAGVKCPGKKTVRVKLREKYITASGWPKKLVIKLATPGWSRKLRKHTSRKHKYCHPCAFHEQNPHLFLKDCSIHYWADITKCHLEMKIGRPRRWGGDSPDQYYYVCPPGHYDLVISCKCQIDPFGLMGFRPVKPKDKANR